MTNWIMSCVTSSSFTVLVNGDPTDFFRSESGLHQGFPLFPLLFILVMEGLSLLLKKSREEGSITCIKVSRLTNILHFLFVDDVLILSRAILLEWKEIEYIIDLFCSSVGITLNLTKSTIHYEGLTEDDLTPFKALLPYYFSALCFGFKYLGYFLKICPHHVADWSWLVSKLS
jgi:hypothetical protein